MSAHTAQHVSFNLDARYQPVKVVGGGVSGFVAAAIDKNFRRPDGQYDMVAVKKVFLNKRVDAECLRLLREIRVLSHFTRFPHPHVLSLRDIFIEPQPKPSGGGAGGNGTPSLKDFDCLYVVTDLLETDLHRAVKLNPEMKEEHFKYIIYQVLTGVRAIHTAGIIHRDIKPQNILINSDCHVKLADFGLSRSICTCPYSPDLSQVCSCGSHFVSVPSEPMSEYVVTRWYRAPEVLLECPYGKPVDIWSVGCVLAEMLLEGRVLFQGHNPLEQIKLICAVRGSLSQEHIERIQNPRARKFLATMKRSEGRPLRSLFPAEVSDLAVDLLEHMLDLDPTTRYTIDQCMQHPFFRDYLRPEHLTFSMPTVMLPEDHRPFEMLISRSQIDKSSGYSAFKSGMFSDGIKQLIRANYKQWRKQALKALMTKCIDPPVEREGGCSDSDMWEAQAKAVQGVNSVADELSQQSSFFAVA
eukprot:GILI01002630.1.p1 GENE.GILI01002630.1~~GILI01002630.1.p1  ORF type:complete len:469 (+),score=71.99 GILI01002630.1:428-1834(+)